MSLYYCEHCRGLYGPGGFCPTCQRAGPRVESFTNVSPSYTLGAWQERAQRAERVQDAFSAWVEKTGLFSEQARRGRGWVVQGEELDALAQVQTAANLAKGLREDAQP